MSPVDDEIETDMFQVCAFDGVDLSSRTANRIDGRVA